MEIKLPDKPLGQHGVNVYYKNFSVVSPNFKSRTYELGQFYTIKKPSSDEVVIAEIQLIWQNTKDSKKYASARLYFHRENEDVPENHEFAEDEVIVADRQVVIECSKVPDWECSTEEWYKDVGHMAYHQAPSWVKELYENQLPKNTDDMKLKVRILGFAQYCRYMACLKMVNIGMKMSYKTLLAKGGVELSSLNTIIMFQRATFKNHDIEDYTYTDGVRVPAFSGRPRKRKKVYTHKKSKSKENCNPSCKSPHIAKLPKRNAAIMATCALADAVQIIESSHNDNATTPDGTFHSETKKQKKYDFASNDKDKKTINVQPNYSSFEDFDKKLAAFMENRGTPLGKIPKLGYCPVNLEQLFNIVKKYGGYGQVTLKRIWRNVYVDLGERHFPGITNAATCLRKIYEKFLLPYEKHVAGEGKRKRKSLNSSYVKGYKNHTSETIFSHECQSKQNNVAAFAFEKSDGSKLFIQKRRGRPSNAFRKQIEQLKASKTLKVEIFPPLNKSARVPSWMNDLDADIINKSKRRKLSHDEDKQDKKEKLIVISNKCSQITPEENPITTFETNESQKIGQELIPIRKPIDVILSRSESPQNIHRKIESNNQSKLIISTSSNQKLASFPASISLKTNVQITKSSVGHPTFNANYKLTSDTFPRTYSPIFTKGPKIKKTPIYSGFKPKTLTTYMTGKHERALPLPVHHHNTSQQHFSASAPPRGVNATNIRYTKPTTQRCLQTTEFIPVKHLHVDTVRHTPYRTNYSAKGNEIKISPNEKHQAIMPRVHHVPSHSVTMTMARVHHVPARSVTMTMSRVHHAPSRSVTINTSRVHHLPVRTVTMNTSNTQRFIEKSKVLFSSDRASPYVTKFPDMANKYVLHEPREPANHGKNQVYPILYTHVPHQFVNSMKHESRSMVITEPISRTDRLLHPRHTVVSSTNNKVKYDSTCKLNSLANDSSQLFHKVDDSDIIIVPRNWR